MNIVSLQTFLAIVENGSLVRASHELNVTQSTVTAPASERRNARKAKKAFGFD